MTPGGANPDEVATQAIVRALQDVWNAHDMKAFAGEFAKDADFVNVAGRWWKPF